MVHLEAVSKRYGPRTVVHDLSFEVRKGEIVGFLGPNGAGKTTTMRMIAGFTTPSAGASPSRASTWRRRTWKRRAGSATCPRTRPSTT